MSDTDDEFTVRLGRIGNRTGRKATGYVKRVRKVAARAGVAQPRRGTAFTGSRIGRGHAEGTASAIRRTDTTISVIGLAKSPQAAVLPTARWRGCRRLSWAGRRRWSGRRCGRRRPARGYQESDKRQ